MRTQVVILLIAFLFAGSAAAQVGIGTTNPHQSAILELSSPDQGLLIPRVGNDKRLGMTPVNGLILYDLDMKQFFVYENDAWSPIAGGGGDGAWVRDAGDGITRLFVASDRVGIGLTNPSEQLQITNNFRLPMSTAGVGNIYKDGNLFLHNYGTNNTFLGVTAGNLSLGGSHNTGIGYKALNLQTTGLRNTAIGSGALSGNTTGGYSVAVGHNALQSQTGNAADNTLANTAVGNESLLNLNPTTATDGRYNSALGYRAGSGLTTGYGNVMIGYQAGSFGTALQTGHDNVIIGSNASMGDANWSNVVLIGAGAVANGKNQVRLGNSDIEEMYCMGAYLAESASAPNMVVNSSGQIMRSTAGLPAGSGAAGKVAFWSDAGTLSYNNNLHWDNTNQRLGVGASAPNTKLTVGNGTYATFAVEAPAGLTGTKNNLAGIGTGRVLTTGANNSLYGHNAGYSLTTGSSNIAVGKESLYRATSASGNAAVGDSALYNTTSGGRNLAFGSEALYANTTGGSNLAIGTRALRGNTTASGLVAIGDSTLFSNTTGVNNIAVGSNALYANTTGYMNLALGKRALAANTTGYQNTASGFEAMKTNATGNMNAAFGARSLEANTSGSVNAALGFEALNDNTSGYGNVALGTQALYKNTTGSRSVAIGDSALLSNVTGTGNVAVGYKAGFHETSSNHFYLDNQYRGTAADGRSKALMYGTFAGEPEDQKLAINGQVSIGTTSPAYSAALHVSGTDKGVIIPRLTTTQRNAIVNPAQGLLIYNTTFDRFEYYDGDDWNLMISTLSASGSSAEGSGYCSEGVTDYDGHHYRVVKIGDRCWMAENLKSTHYSDGSSISEAYVYVDDPGREHQFGRLYTWAAVMHGAGSSNSKPSGVQGACPAGWHVPSDEEWKELEMSLGMPPVFANVDEDWRGTLYEGARLKETPEAHLWATSSDPGNNQSGFTAVPAGSRSSAGDYLGLGEYTSFYTATEWDVTDSYFRSLFYDYHQVYRGHSVKTSARSVRCVKDY